MTTAAGTGAARLLRAAGTALPVLLGAVAAAGAIVLLARPDAWTIVAVPLGLALGAVAWLRPVLAVAVLLAIAPICGNRPTTGPFVAFIGLTACAVPGWLARLVARDRRPVLDLLGTPAGLAFAAYVGASLLSLSSLPLYEPEEMLGAASIGEALRLLPGALAGADVAAPMYPVLTVVLTVHAAVAALVVAVGVRRDGSGAAATDRAGAARGGIDAARLVTGAILSGLVATIAAGTLDRFGLLDLRMLRTPDPFTNATGAERLQATFGHAGWFAEYVCFATPTILAVWLWPAPATRRGRGVRTGAAIMLLAVALVAIVLSYQRGGWITWAVVGAGVAAAMARLAAAGGPPTSEIPMRRLVAAAAMALIVAIPAGVLAIRIAGGPGAMDRFALRARTLTQVSDRQAHVTAGLRLGALLPILGGGSESFAMRYRQEYLRSGGEFYARGYSPVLDMYGSAHNVFAQTFAGKGAVGLVALVLVVLTAAAAAIRRLRQPDTSRADGVVATIVLGMLAAFVIYGQVQEVFYIAPLQLTVFAAFGLALAFEPSLPSASRGIQRLGIVALLLIAALGAHLVQAYAIPGRLAEEYRDRAISREGARLSAPVRGEDGEYFQWTGRRAVVTVPRQATELSLELRRGGPGAREVEVRFDGRLIDRVRLDDDGWRHVAYPLQRVRILPRRLEIVVTAASAPTSPAADAHAESGVAVRRIRWGM